jgi:hypothetical protein
MPQRAQATTPSKWLRIILATRLIDSNFDRMAWAQRKLCLLIAPSTKAPAKHGIDMFIIDRRFIRTATLWEIAEAAGKRVGLYDWLVTYPPQELDGFVIPGWLAGGKSTTHLVQTRGDSIGSNDISRPDVPSRTSRSR